MSHRTVVFAVVLALAACGGPLAGPSHDTGLLAGTLDPDSLPASSVVGTTTGLQVYGLVQVPAGTRLQAAYAVADAAARAELTRRLEVRITALDLNFVSDDGEFALRACLERARAWVPGLSPAAHGVRANADGRNLRVAARFDLPRESVVELLRSAFPAAEPGAIASAAAQVIAVPEAR